MKNIKLFTPFNAPLPKGEVLDLDTVVTVPDQALTPRQIVDRALKGLPLDSIAHGIYFDDDETEEPDETLNPDFDLADATRVVEEISNSEVVRRKARDQRKKEIAQQSQTAPPSQGEKRRSEADEQRAEGTGEDVLD